MFLLAEEGVPNSCIPTGVRDAFPDITTAINKSYDRLEVADCVRLLWAVYVQTPEAIQY